MQPRVYASGIAGRIAALVGGAVAVPLVAIGLPLVVLQQILGIREQRILIGVCVGILVVGGIWVLVHVFVTGPVRFDTDAQTVRLRRGFRVTNEWQRAGTVFGSLVTRQSTNGIPTGSLRKIFATTAGERIEVPATWFSARTFNDLMADLAPVGALPADAAATASTTERSRTFALNPKAGSLQGTVRSVVIVLLVGVFLSLGVFAWLLVSDPTSDPEALVFVVAIALFVTIVVLIVWISGRRRAARMPAAITVTPSTLQIDDTTLYYGQLASIELTPPSYSGNRRTLALVEKIGTRTVYALGAAPVKGVQAFADYDEFVELLGRVAPAGVVRFDLR